MLPEENLTPLESKLSWKIKSLLLFGGIIVVVAATFSGYFFSQYKNKTEPVATDTSTPIYVPPTDTPSVGEPVPDGNGMPPEMVQTIFPTVSLPMEINSKIVWSQPKKIVNQQWFKTDLGVSEEEQYRISKYYEVGSFELAGDRGRIILSETPSEGPGPVWYFYIVEFKKQLTVLAKYSWYDGYDKQYDQNPANTLETYLNTFTTNTQKLVNVDSQFTIASLEFPKTLIGPKGRQVLILRGVYPLQERVGFSNVTVKAEVPVFSDPKFGTVFTSAVTGGFYIHGPDGTRAAYALVPDFFNPTSSQAQIVWNDGSWNAYEYMYGDQGGCGAMNYISVVTSSDITVASNLEIVGKNSKGDAIYELKDKNHRLLKTFYESAYFPQESGYKVSYEEFVTLKPIIFWVDPFGRLIKMQNKRFIIPAECGKPVIYLYPEKTTTVSVKVEPKGGMTVSDPFYNGGWRVQAEPNGQLTELKSGQKYPYLFWEGSGDVYQTPKRGFMIKREEVAREIPQKLQQLGLNQNEIKDFMEFWYPRMQAKPYYFVTFLGTQQMNELAPLTVTPVPDSVVRILMDFTPLDQPYSVEPLYLGTIPQRKGFTVIEWGGVIRK
ncbi:MAG: hypothetical protein KBC69_03960 [Candidatus Magasanikbacteria bacterium]|nr:hypothetical protein [Candidatus Magasanikbacteria bacterium]